MNIKFHFLLTFVLFVLTLVACQAATQTPFPTPVVQEETFGNVVSTNTPTVTSTIFFIPSATLTRTPVPTYTPRPIKTPLPTATNTSLPGVIPQDFTAHPLPGIGTPFAKSDEVITEENLANLHELARWGKGVIVDMEFSPDGKWLGVAAMTGVYLYDTENWEEQMAINFEKTVWAFAFAQDSQHFAVSFDERMIQIMDIYSLQPLQSFQMERGPAELTFLAGDRYLLSTSDYDMAELWDLDANRSVSLPALVGGAPDYVIPSVDGKTFAVINGSEIRFWDFETGEFSQVYSGVDDYFPGVAKSEAYFVQSSWSGSFEVRRAGDGEVVWTADAWCYECFELFLPGNHSPVCEYGSYDPQPASISYFQFSPNENFLFTFFLGQIQIREASNGNLVRQIDSNTPLTISPDGQWQAWGAPDGIIHIEQASNSQEIKILVGYTPGVREVEFGSDQQVVIKSADAYRLRALQDGGLYRKLEVNELAISADGAWLALGYTDGKVEIRNYTDFSLIHTLENNPYPVSHLEFSPHGNWLLSIHDCMVYGTDTQTWTKRYVVNTVQAPVSVLIFPNEEMFLLSHWDETERYQLSDGFLVGSSGISFTEGRSIFSTDGTALINFDSHNLLFYDLMTEALQTEISMNWNSARSGRFSPDSSLFAAVDLGGTLRVWRVADWQLLLTATNSTDRLNSLAFSPDGKYIALGSWNGTVSIWGIAP